MCVYKLRAINAKIYSHALYSHSVDGEIKPLATAFRPSFAVSLLTTSRTRYACQNVKFNQFQCLRWKSQFPIFWEPDAMHPGTFLSGQIDVERDGFLITNDTLKTSRDHRLKKIK